MQEPGQTATALPRLARLALACVVIVGLAHVPAQLYRWLRDDMTVAALWPDPEVQYRRLLGPVPYDLLRAADAMLPPEAGVLLVTPGRDVRHWDYTTYHRALYFLAPRPVWWVAPAQPDDTWEARWWTATPLEPEAIRAVAAEHSVACVLVADPALDVPLGTRVAAWPQGYLLTLAGQGQCKTTVPAVAAKLGQLWPLQVALALAAPWLLGALVLRLATRLRLHIHPLEGAALAWQLGSGLITVLLLWLAATGLSFTQQRLVLSGAIALAWAGLAVRRKPWVVLLAWLRQPRNARSGGMALPPVREMRPRAWQRLGLAGLALGLLTQGVLVVALSVGRPLAIWDSWVNWGLKARIIWLENGLSSAVYAEPARAVTLLDYPLSAPLFQAWLFSWLGAPDDRLAGLPLALAWFGLLGLGYGGLRRRGATRGYALLAAAALALMPHLAVLAGSAYPDIIIACLTAAAALFLVEYLQGGSRGALLVAVVAAGLLAWTKREGLVSVAALGLAALVSGMAAWRQRAQAAGLLTLGAALLAGPWWAWMARERISNPAFLPLSVEIMLANSGRLPFIAQAMARMLLGSGSALAWPLAAGVWVAGLRRQAPRWHCGQATTLLLVAPALYLGTLAPVYLLSDYGPYQQHVLSSAWRLIAHVTPLPLLWLARHGLTGSHD